MKRSSAAGLVICAGLAGGFFFGCQAIKALRGQKASDGPVADNRELDEDVSAYARYCRQELGFEGVEIPPLNCLDGAEVPLLINGQPPTEAEYDQLSRHKIGCDQPSWLEGVGCVNYNFVLHRKVTPDVDLALICRNRNFTTRKDRVAREKAYLESSNDGDFRSLFYFDSLGMIVTNNKTGKTCFFDQVEATYGGFIPFPDRKDPPRFEELPMPRPTGQAATNPVIVSDVLNLTPSRTWKKPFLTARIDRCTMCHDSGPWKHSPWLPPSAGIPSNPRGVPMIAVGPAFTEWRTVYAPASVTTAPVDVQGKKEPQLCTSCHRMGLEMTCKSAMDFATGKRDADLLSDAGKAARRRHWMPPPKEETKGLSDTDFARDWADRYQAHYDAMRRCCDNPKQDGCVILPFGQ